MIEWIFFFGILIIAIVVYILLVRKKERIKKVADSESITASVIASVVDVLD